MTVAKSIASVRCRSMRLFPQRTLSGLRQCPCLLLCIVMYTSRCLIIFARVSWGVRSVMHTRDSVGCREARVLLVFAELLTTSAVHVHVSRGSILKIAEVRECNTYYITSTLGL